MKRILPRLKMNTWRKIARTIFGVNCWLRIAIGVSYLLTVLSIAALVAVLKWVLDPTLQGLSWKDILWIMAGNRLPIMVLAGLGIPIVVTIGLIFARQYVLALEYANDQRLRHKVADYLAEFGLTLAGADSQKQHERPNKMSLWLFTVIGPHILVFLLGLQGVLWTDLGSWLPSIVLLGLVYLIAASAALIWVLGAALRLRNW